ncbi:MAG: glycosyl transferase [Pseudonocardia sp. SCN 72-86]|nr:MAG: glycosyl transferase [Pseudonocardia sp. SCN 72-86]
MSTSTLSPPRPPAPVPPGRHRPRLRRVRGETIALGVLLVGTAVLYLWNLSASGYANEYYAAAVQAGTTSWKAWLFGSLDPGNAITVDKPPASLWIMTASARIFGFSSWSLLVPQALMGVAAVALLRAAVRRWVGPVAGIAAGAALALTPAAVLMFRFDNPDALLTLLLVAGAYAIVRAVDAASTRAATWWVVAAGAAVGFGFLAKMGQAMLVLPAFGLVYVLARPGRLRTRLLGLGAGLVATVVSAGWFVALVELWPAGSRPYIGGSTTNSLLELALGYNGIGRLLGGSGNGEGGGGGAGGGNSGFGGEAGITRLFSGEIALEVSWLLPAALIAIVALVCLAGRRPRTDKLRAAAALWGGWTLVTGVVFSFMSGTMHPYYTVALAPGIAALVAVGAVALWRSRAHLAARVGLALMVASTAAWSAVLLLGSGEPYAWLGWVVAGLAVPGLVAVLLPAGSRRPVATGVLAAVLAASVGTSSYAVATAATAHSGSIPSVGTSASSSMSMGGPGGGFPGGGTPPTAAAGGTASGDAALSAPADDGTGSGGAMGGGGGTGAGGTGGGATSEELVALLSATDSTWSAAVSTSQTAASLELATGTAVMSTGGWSGSDSAITLAEFQAEVAAGHIHYWIGGGQGGGPGGGSDSTSSQIAAWVEATFTASTVGGQTVYDLTT